MSKFSEGEHTSQFVEGENTSQFSEGEMVPTRESSSGHLTTVVEDNRTIVPMPQPQRVSTSGTLVPFDLGGEMFKPTTSTDFLPSVDRWIQVGGMVLVGIVGAAIGLSTILKYKVTVQAPASIRPLGDLRLVQSTIEGSILSIFAREHQTVRKGDIIAMVKDTRLESRLQTKRSQLAGEIQKDKYQIQAIDNQIAAFDRQVVAEAEQNQRGVAITQAELARAERDYRDRQITSQAEVDEAEANWRTADRERQAAVMELDVTAANLKSIQAAYASAATRLERYQQAAAAGAISTNQLEEAQLAAQQQQQSIAAQFATMAKQRKIIDRAAETVSASAARIKKLKAALNPSPAETEAIGQKIASQQASGQAAIAKLQQDRQRLLQQRAEMVERVNTNARELAQIATDLKPTLIRAPISGTIQELNLRNDAQVVRPGDRIAQILPSSTPLDIKAAVAISDIDNVKVGQKVQMRVSSCPYSDYGVISGRVSAVSADVKVPEQNPARPPEPAANGIYEVTIKPDARQLVQGTKKCQIRSGMDGRVDIISKEESVFQFAMRKARIFDF